MKNPILRDTLVALGFRKPEPISAPPNRDDKSKEFTKSKNRKSSKLANSKRNKSSFGDPNVINKDSTQISYRRQLAANQTAKTIEKSNPKKPKKKSSKSNGRARIPSFSGKISAGVLAMQRQINDWSEKRAASRVIKAIEEPETPKPISEMTFDELKSKWQSGVGYLGKFSRNGLAEEDILRVRARVEAIEQEWLHRVKLLEADPDCFEWPSTQLNLDRGSLGYGGTHEDGYLGYIGYHVGKTSELLAHERSHLLSKIFMASLPPLNDLNYFKSWAIPGSAARLRKMAELIANLAKSRKGRTVGDWSVAIAHWELDLQYLHDEHYVGKFDFFWPR